MLALAACGDPGSRDGGAPLDAGTGEDAGARLDAGQPRDAGAVTDAGSPADGGASVDAGVSAFCDACVRSEDCAPGALCLGGLEARCSLDCSSMSCPGGATCQGIGVGMGPRLGHECLADESTICGAFTQRAGLDCSDDWSGYAQGFFAASCIGSCHRHDGAWTTRDGVRAQAEQVRLAVDTGAMPVGDVLTEAERRRLLTWFACGAP